MSTDQVISISSSTHHHQNPIFNNGSSSSSNPPVKKKRNLPGTPDPEAEVISLSPKTLMATNRFLCEICGKGFQRDQNLQLHRRGHNLPWKLKQRSSNEVRKRVYVCPEKTCVHHHPSRALGDLTGIKKHYCRKHGEKKWKCDKCSKRYAVHSDWKAHSKTCGTREYKCDCGTIFSRRDSFITHRAFCDALAEETARFTAASQMTNHHFIGSSPLPQPNLTQQYFPPIFRPNDQTLDPTIINNIPPGRALPLWMAQNPSLHLHETHPMTIPISSGSLNIFTTTPQPTTYQPNWDFTNKFSPNAPADQDLTNHSNISVPSLFSSQEQAHQPSAANISATALLQKAAQIGSTTNNNDDPSFLDGSNKFVCGLYGSSSATSGLGSDVDVEGSINDVSALNQLEMYRHHPPPPIKRRRVVNSSEEIMKGGETRDFLGVGVQSICHPSSINGWI